MNPSIADRAPLTLEEKRALLAKTIRRQAGRVKTAPMSVAQERLWFISKLLPGSFAYNIPLGMHITGKVEYGALHQALAAVAARHETLRTRFRSVQELPVQEIAASLRVSLPLIDLRTLPTGRRYREERRLSHRLSARSFELDVCPLWQATLVRSAAEAQSFYLVIHHIVFDDWSASLFGRELKANYRAYLDGKPPPAAPLAIQYSDFARWQREWLKSAPITGSVGYWREKLLGVPALALPTDHPRPPIQTFFGRHEEFDLSAENLVEITAYCRRSGTTLFAVLLALFNTVLGAYSGQSDIPVGSPTAGRSRLETEELIGFFVNMMVLRTDLAGCRSFADVVGRTKAVVREALAHQHVPFEMLVTELRPERDMSRNPLFQVAFVLLNVSNADYELSETSARNISMAHPGAKFDLTLALSAADGVLHGILEYNTDLFERVTAKRIVESLGLTLDWVLRDPLRELGELPLVTESTRWQLVGEWNATAAEYPRSSTIHALFEGCAAERPQDVALIDGDLELTYAEVNQHANRLAHALVARGVAAEQAVAVCLQRSWRLVVALLAVLKAGGVYVPLDAGEPAERLRFVLEDCGAKIVLADAALEAELPAATSRFLLDRDIEAARRFPSGNLPASRSWPEGLAYLMYTSGSTGRPKAVATPHRAVVRLVRGSSFADMGPAETFLQLAPASFDAATLEIWGPLLNGGKLAIMPPGPVSLDDLAAALARHEVTTLWLTAGLFHRMVDDRLEGLVGLGRLIAGGDALSPSHVARVIRELPGTRLVNGYGPTESTTFACCAALDDAEGNESAVAIGRPIANTRVHVLDGRLGLVPIGVAGELCIAGDGLARGYLNRAALTAERFAPDPFGGPGTRLYRTGDLVRRRLDGSLEFLGRIDSQVKVRGFRIELGEVEAALLQHPAVREAVVVVRAETGEKRLVAYAVYGAEAPAIEALRAFVGERLPDYMVPAAFIGLPALPLTANGKIDRKRLPAPEERRPQLAAHFVAPDDDSMQSVVAAIWQELLGLDRIGVDDNFFDLGGSSLLIVQAHTRLQAKLGREIPIMLLFNYPNVRTLAAQLQAAPADSAGGATAEAGADDGRAAAATNRARQLAVGKGRLRRQAQLADPAIQEVTRR